MAVHLYLVCTGAIPAQGQLPEDDGVLTDMACWLMGSEFTSTAGRPVCVCLVALAAWHCSVKATHHMLVVCI